MQIGQQPRRAAGWLAGRLEHCGRLHMPFSATKGEDCEKMKPDQTGLNGIETNEPKPNQSTSTQTKFRTRSNTKPKPTHHKQSKHQTSCLPPRSPAEPLQRPTAPREASRLRRKGGRGSDVAAVVRATRKPIDAPRVRQPGYKHNTDIHRQTNRNICKQHTCVGVDARGGGGSERS